MISGWSSKASEAELKGVEGGDCERGTLGGENRRQKSLRIGVHHADAVVWEPVYRTHLTSTSVAKRRRTASPSAHPHCANAAGSESIVLPTALTLMVAEARSISHWFPYDRVRVVNADP